MSGNRSPTYFKKKVGDIDLLSHLLIFLSRRWKELQTEYDCDCELSFVTVQEYMKLHRWLRRSLYNMPIDYYPFARTHYDFDKWDKSRAYLFVEKLGQLQLTKKNINQVISCIDRTIQHEMGHCLNHAPFYVRNWSTEQSMRYQKWEEDDRLYDMLSHDCRTLELYYAKSSEHEANESVGLDAKQLIDDDKFLCSLT